MTRRPSGIGETQAEAIAMVLSIAATMGVQYLTALAIWEARQERAEIMARYDETNLNKLRGE